MTYKLEFMDIALQDAAQIRDYLSGFYENTVRRFIDSLDSATLLLRDNPYIGSVYREYRKLVVGNYLVFYKVCDEKHTVRIYRIISGMKNYDDLGSIR